MTYIMTLGFWILKPRLKMTSSPYATNVTFLKETYRRKKQKQRLCGQLRTFPGINTTTYKGKYLLKKKSTTLMILNVKKTHIGTTFLSLTEKCLSIMAKNNNNYHIEFFFYSYIIVFCIKTGHLPED